MYIKNCSLMRMVQAYSKQYAVIEQRRFMYIKKLLFTAGGPDIFKAIFSDRTAEVHVYKKLLFDADVPGIIKARFRDRTAEVHVYKKNCSLMRMVWA